MNAISDTEKCIKYIVLGCVITAGFVFYSLNATKSGLWYDEAIEYYYSKYLTGPVPGGDATENMYERILLTFQPPLYNILMFLWLSVFDSEFTFRLAGILVTMIGSIGCFLAVEEFRLGSIWSIACTAFYLFTPQIIFYGLECAEYHLLFCFLAWTMYFYFRVLCRQNMTSLLGFFVFACAAVYSQYGAAFIIVPLYLSVIAFLLCENNLATIKHLMLMTFVTLIVAVLPLLLFFTIPQMKHQGSLAVSHTPYFEHGFLTDFFIGGKSVLALMFGNHMVFGVLFLIVICCVATVLQPRRLLFPVLSNIVAWMLYFAAVCCSFYGYNNWLPTSIGSMNLDSRYSFFLIPGLVITLVTGLGIVVNWAEEKFQKRNNLLTAVAIVCLAVFCLNAAYKVETNEQKKDDVREIVSVWYECGGFASKTIVHHWDHALFDYYVTHDDRYIKKYSDTIEFAYLWTPLGEHDELMKKIHNSQLLSLDEYYYITPGLKAPFITPELLENTPAVLSALTNAGYRIERVYAGESLLLHISK